jgi:hypothetical protein
MQTRDAHADRPLRRRGVRRPAILIGLIIVMIAVSIPVVTHPLPPLSDYINNLARAHVIATIGSDPDFQRFYTVEWEIIPNMMIGLIVPLLQRFMNIYAAGQVFVIGSFFLILSGTLALNRALLRRLAPAPLLAGLLLYNGVLLVGVVNYIFGIGLALWAFTAWVALRDRFWPWRFFVSVLFVLVLFICHLFALGVYGLALLSFESWRLWARRDEPLGRRLIGFIATGLPFIPALLLLLESATWDLAPQIEWHLGGKLEGLMLTIGVYNDAIALIMAAIVAAAAGAAAWNGLLRVHPAAWFLAGFGLAAYLAMPRSLFASHLADQRLPLALFFLLMACVDLDLTRRRVRQAFAALLAVLLVLRIAEVQIVWDRLSRDIAAFHQSVLPLERGARILVTHGDRDAFHRERVSDLGLLHAASLATIERSALVSTTFAVSGKQVLQVRDDFRRFVDTNDGIPPSADWLRLAAGPVDQTDRFYWSQWPRHYDYVYVLFTRSGDKNPDGERLTLLQDGPGFQLYRVIKPN